MSLPDRFQHPYKIDPKFNKSVAYFSMEFAIAQPLKIYSGGLGFLAGSHMRSAYELKQNMIGIGILWKYGYYDQIRKGDQSMDVLFQEKYYNFLEDTGIDFTITLNKHEVSVKVWYLPPEVFKSAPLFLLSTDLPENDYLAQSTSHKLYDADPSAKVAQSILLGIGGMKLLDVLGHQPEVYHMNEAHALSGTFYLYQKYKELEEVKKRVVFTTHTPEEAGNEKHDISFLEELGFFSGLALETVREITGTDDNTFNHTLVALRMSRKANGVSKLHGEVANKMWAPYAKENSASITHITNAQSRKYWQKKIFADAMERDDMAALKRRKLRMKEELFDIVADQTGVILDPQVLTIVWARRFAGYKRADLIARDEERFHRLLTNNEFPVQIIWAGKPYPMDYTAISMFNKLVHLSKKYKRTAVLVGYELQLSRMLKNGADIWLNNPRVPREASGTSGMSAAMNAAVNFSTFDGWIREYAHHGFNSFIIPEADLSLPEHEQDAQDQHNLYEILEKEILPVYYREPDRWMNIVRNSMKDVLPYFDSDRMAYEYYDKLYS
jgi:starch phosphorylase